MDSKVDLNETPWIPCPFHGSTGNKFSYSSEKNICRCWSKCGGGDVIWLHQMNYHLRNRDTAIDSMLELLGLSKFEIDFSDKRVKVDELVVKMISYISRAEGSCKTVEDYLNLDFIMSQRKPAHEAVKDIEAFLKSKGVHL